MYGIVCSNKQQGSASHAKKKMFEEEEIMNNKYRGRGKVSLSVQSTSFIWEWAATGEHLAPFSLNLKHTHKAQSREVLTLTAWGKNATNYKQYKQNSYENELSNSLAHKYVLFLIHIHVNAMHCFYFICIYHNYTTLI